MSSGDKYVFAAYAAVLVTVLVYLAIHSLRLARLERELEQLAGAARTTVAEREEISVG